MGLQKDSSNRDLLNLRQLRCPRNHDGLGRPGLNEISIEQRSKTDGVRFQGISLSDCRAREHHPDALTLLKEIAGEHLGQNQRVSSNVRIHNLSERDGLRGRLKSSSSNCSQFYEQAPFSGAKRPGGRSASINKETRYSAQNYSDPQVPNQISNFVESCRK